VVGCGHGAGGAVAAQGEPIIDGQLTTVLVDAADGTRMLSLIGDLDLATSPPVERQPCGPPAIPRERGALLDRAGSEVAGRSGVGRSKPVVRAGGRRRPGRGLARGLVATSSG
jgi:hypothetical protein